MVDKLINKRSMKLFVLVSKVLPMILAFFHLINIILSFFYIDCVILNYIASISILTITYLYFVSYILKLCSYYRMFLHYTVIIDIINIIDYYIHIPIEDISMLCIYLIITIFTIFLVIYLKFFK